MGLFSLLYCSKSILPWFSLLFKMRFGRVKANNKNTRSSATERSETLFSQSCYVQQEKKVFKAERFARQAIAVRNEK